MTSNKSARKRKRSDDSDHEDSMHDTTVAAVAQSECDICYGRFPSGIECFTAECGHTKCRRCVERSPQCMQCLVDQTDNKERRKEAQQWLKKWRDEQEVKVFAVSSAQPVRSKSGRLSRAADGKEAKSEAGPSAGRAAVAAARERAEEGHGAERPIWRQTGLLRSRGGRGEGRLGC
jgi:hypothetical protein